MGTAIGDLTAYTFGLGYFASGLIFAGVIMIPAIGYWRPGWDAIFAFWFAYVVTRPLGASFADWLCKPPSVGGLGSGSGTVALALAIIAREAFPHNPLMRWRDGSPHSARDGAAPRHERSRELYGNLAASSFAGPPAYGCRCYPGTTVTAHPMPGARLNRASAVSRSQPKNSASAT
jgi:hypothetical protein